MTELASVPNHHPFPISHQVNVVTISNIMILGDNTSRLSPWPRCEWMLGKSGKIEVRASFFRQHQAQTGDPKGLGLPTKYFLPHYLVSVTLGKVLEFTSHL